MSDEKITLNLEKRETFGRQVKQLRRDGTVPAVIHDHGKESVHVQAPFMQMTKVFQAAGKHHPVELKLGDKDYLALIRDADFEPKKHTLRHVVFNAIDRNQKTTAEIPVVLTEDIPAEKNSLIVLKQLDHIEVEALPKDLVDEITVDASSLVENGDRLHVSDIKAPEGITILTDPEMSIAVVEIPRDQVAEADAAAKELAEADAEGGEEVPSEHGEASDDEASADGESADASEGDKKE